VHFTDQQAGIKVHGDRVVQFPGMNGELIVMASKLKVQLVKGLCWWRREQREMHLNLHCVPRSKHTPSQL
jgi:hypothetical protein